MLKYEMIANDLQQKIRDGVYSPSQQLPIVSELCDMYGVSKITVKKAMDELVMHGLIVKRRGSGSFVKDITVADMELPYAENSKQLLGFTSEHEGEVVTNKVLQFSIERPSEKVAEKLRMSSEDFVYHICRVRSASGIPQDIEYCYMPINLIPGVTNSVVEGSIYRHIEKTLRLKIFSAHRTVRAVEPTREEREHLKIEGSTPLLEVEQVVFLEDGRLFEYSISRHNGNLYEFYSISVR